MNAWYMSDKSHSKDNTYTLDAQQQLRLFV